MSTLLDFDVNIQVLIRFIFGNRTITREDYMHLSDGVIYSRQLAKPTTINPLTLWIVDHPKKCLSTQAALLSLAIISRIISRKTTSGDFWRDKMVKQIPKLFFVPALGLALKTLWHWRHLFDQIIYERLAIPYTPSISYIFEPRQIKDHSGNILVELKYQEHLPILWFNSSVTDPKERGRLEGLLLGEDILNICRLGIQPIMTYLAWEKGAKGQIHLEDCMQTLNIPPHIQHEFDGICEGFKERFPNHNKITSLDPEKFIKSVHILSDAFKAVGTSFACSIIACYNEKNELMIGRNFDWPSMGYIGQRQLVKQYTVGDKRINLMTFPGYVGAITAWNSEGLVVIVNELGRISLGRGTPYCLITKRLIEECKSVEEAKKLIQIMHAESPCASSVTIMIADQKNASLVQFYAEDLHHYHIRDLKPNQPPFIVTNHYEDQDGNVIEKSICEPNSVKREMRMKKACSENSSQSAMNVIEAALKAAGVPATIGTFTLDPSKNVKITFDNFNAHRLIDKVNALHVL